MYCELHGSGWLVSWGHTIYLATDLRDLTRRLCGGLLSAKDACDHEDSATTATDHSNHQRLKVM